MLNRLSNYLVILVATYNRLELLKRAIHSINAGTRCSHEIIVIDGGSTDGTIEYLRSHSGITPVFQERLVGQARACNEVWRNVESKYTCWLNDDVELIPGSLDLAVDVLEKNPRIGMVGLKMVDTIGPGALKGYGGAVSEYGILNCNHGVLPLSVLRLVGYFNEQHRMYGIDPDLTASVLSAGKTVVLTKRACVLHHRVGADPFQRKSEIDNSRIIYRTKFKYLQASSYLSSGWRKKFRKKIWNLLLLHLPSGSTRFGLNARDLVNLVEGRFIHFLDPLKNITSRYYLEQRIPDKFLFSTPNPYRHLVGIMER